MEMGYTKISNLPEDWVSYDIQRKAGELGAPTESTISIVALHHGRDIVEADKKLKDKEVELLRKGLQTEALSTDTVMPEGLQKIIDQHEETKAIKEKIEKEIY